MAIKFDVHTNLQLYTFQFAIVWFFIPDQKFTVPVYAVLPLQELQDNKDIKY